MIVGIMQPYFLPNIGHFSLINSVDKWIVFDIVQFIRHGWIERNRTLKPSEGWQYISVPLVKHNRETIIKDIQIRNNEAWQEKILNQLVHYKKKAPYYNDVIPFLKESLEYKTDSITLLNTHLLNCVCSYLDIPFNYEICSEMNLDLNSTHPGDWAFQISKAINAETYINPIGGRDLFDTEQFEINNISIKFIDVSYTEYRQKGQPFEAGLSIIDVMMFNSKEQIKEMLNQFKLI